MQQTLTVQAPTRRTHSLVPALCALVAIALAAIGALMLTRMHTGTTSYRANANGVPVMVVEPASAVSAPTVIVAHGFAGSAQLMDSFATGLARSGVRCVALDFTGHGSNPHVLHTTGHSFDELDDDLDAVVSWARGLPGSSQTGMALVGHSMGAGAVVAYAANHPMAATVALSLPSADALPKGVTNQPKNLLLLYGQREPAMFATAALKALRAAYPNGEVGRAYGAFANGTARQAAVIPGVEHIGIALSPAAERMTAQWLRQALGPEVRPGQGVTVVPVVLLWLLAAMVGCVPVAAVAYRRAGGAIAPVTPVSRARVACVVVSAPLLAAIAASLLRPLEERVPMAVGGYVIVWFAVAGVVQLLSSGPRRSGSGPVSPAVMVSAFAAAAIAVPGALTWSAFALTGHRWWLAVLMLIVFLLYFAGEESLLSGRRGWARLGFALPARALTIVVLLASVPLLGAPAFLSLLAPLMFLLFLVVAAMAAIVARCNDGWLGPALVQAAPMAVLVATTFPLVA